MLCVKSASLARNRDKAFGVQVKDFVLVLVHADVRLLDDTKQPERNGFLAPAFRKICDADGLINHFISLRDRLAASRLADRGESSKLSPEGV